MNGSESLRNLRWIVLKRLKMIESIAFTLLMKKLQIVFIAVAIVVASGLTIYNLPWGEAEWGTLRKSVYRFFSIRVRIQFLRNDVQRRKKDEQGLNLIES